MKDSSDSATDSQIQRIMLKLAALPALALLMLLVLPLLLRQFDKLDAGVQQHAKGVAQVLSRQAGFAIYTGDQWLMQGLLRAVVKSEPAIHTAGFYNADGLALAVETTHLSVSDLRHHLLLEEPVWQTQDGGFVLTMRVEKDPLGVDDFEAKKQDTLDAWVVLQVSDAEVRDEKNRLLSFVLLVALIGLALTVALAYKISRRLTNPLLDLNQTVRLLTLGHLHTRSSADTKGPLQELIQGVCALAERVSETEQDLKARIVDATAELSARTSRAERAEIDKSRLLAAASHDLRTPVYAMRLMCADLLNTPRPDHEQEQVKRLDLALFNQELMLDSLLNISRYESGDFEPTRRPCDLLSMLTELGHEFAVIADYRGLSLRVRGDPITLHTDPGLLRRIVVNLIDNALRYTSQGGVLLSCRRRKESVWLQVWDTGCGIEDKHIHSIFEAYTRRDAAGLNPTGVGLGLALCWRFSLVLEMVLSVSSRPGKGTIFTLKIPYV